MGVVTRLLAGRSGVRIPVGAGGFSVPQNPQTGAGSHPALYLMGAEFLSPGTEWLGCEVEHSFPSRTEVKNEWSCTSTPLICHNGLDRDNFVIYIYIYIYIYMYMYMYMYMYIDR